MFNLASRFFGVAFFKRLHFLIWAIVVLMYSVTVLKADDHYVPQPNPQASAHVDDLIALGKWSDVELIEAMLQMPQAVWFLNNTSLDGTPIEARVSSIVQQASGNGAVPVLVAYYVPSRDCGRLSAGGATSQQDYQEWIDRFAAGIGSAEVIVILEPDSLGMIPWYKQFRGLEYEAENYDWCQPDGADEETIADERFAMLNYAVEALKAQPNARVYLDATHSNWLSVGDAAHRLVQAGVGQADGFFLNVSNFERTEHLEKYGAWISQCLWFATDPASWGVGRFDWCGSQYYPADSSDFTTWSKTDEWYEENVETQPGYPGHAGLKTFVIDTSRNGQGPWIPSTSYTDPQTWCNPPGRGAGRLATTDTNHPLIDAYLWVKIPGESDGQCTRGGPGGTEDPEWEVVDPIPGDWFPEMALDLAHNANPPLQNRGQALTTVCLEGAGSGQDGVLIPVPADFAPGGGMCYQADFNGDGRLDVLVQGHAPGDKTYLFLAYAYSRYNAISQSWRNDYLGLDWSSNNSDLFIDDFNADGRADIIVESGLNGGTSAILYAGSDGHFTAIEYAWENVNPITDKPIVTGTLPGSFDVTPGGAAVYSIPIEVPPGIAGMQPAISLDYNSQGGNGLLGVGWSIGGLSAISRCPRTLAQDGVKGGLHLDANDRFCLNGQRLVAVSGAYGAHGTQYRTEIDSFARVTSHATQGSGPQYFTVETKAGQTLYYGNTEDARINPTGNPGGTVLSWAMNRIEDTVGNYIDFSYFENNATGEHYIDRIDYTGNGAQLPSRSVEFSYDATGRTDASLHYLAGSALRMNARLTNVRTYVFDDRVLDYEFSYDYGPETGQSRVTAIQMCAESECLPATTVAWGDVATAFGTAASTAVSYWNDGSGWDSPEKYSTISSPDITGDGIADFCGKNSFDGILCHKNNGNGTFSSTIIYGPGWGTAWNQDENYSTIQYPDLNGDALADICGRSDNGIICYLGNGAGFDLGASNEIAGPAWANADFVGWQLDQRYSTIQYPDLNGDGRADICAKDVDNIVCHLGTGNGFGDAISGPVWKDSNGWSDEDNYATIQFPDLNGDGLADICARANAGIICHFGTGDGRFSGDVTGPAWDSNTGWQYTRQWSTIRYPDLNSDGMADICGRDGNGLTCYLSTGVSFDLANEIRGPAWSDAFGWNDDEYYRTIQFTNLNGDSFVDVCARASAGIECYLGNGNGFSNTAIAGPALSDANGWHGSTNYPTIQYPDITGDGRPAICGRHDSQGLVCYLQANGRNDVATAFTNGQGATVSVEHLPLTDSSVYTKGSGHTYPEPDFQGPFHAVSRVHADDGLGGQATTEYRYESGRIHYHGRGFLGFEKVITHDLRSDTITETTYRQDFPYTGLVTSSKTTQADKTVSLVSNKHTVYTSDAGLQVPYAYRVQEDRHALTAANDPLSQTLTDTTFNVYGDLADALITVIDKATNQAFVTHTVNTYDPGDWRGRLTRSQVTKTMPSDSQTRVSAFTYDPVTGLLASETIEPDSATLWQTTAYTHDGFGNPRTTTVTGPDIAPRTTETLYTADGYFPDIIINALGHEESRLYDPRFGAMLFLTGPNGLTTAWQYDPFGAKTQEIRADGTTTTWDAYNCDATCTGLEAYYTTTQSSGAPPSHTYFDTLGRELRQVTLGFESAAIERQTRYDDRGRILGTTSPYFQNSGTAYWTCALHDEFDRAIAQTTPDLLNCDNAASHLFSETTYDGLKTTVTIHSDSGDQSKTEWIDVIGQRLKVEDDLTRLEYRYDAYGNLIELTTTPLHEYTDSGAKVPAADPTPVVTAMTYDPRGRKTAMHDPDKGPWSYGHNTLGELIWQTDALGHQSTMQYDLLGRMVNRETPDILNAQGQIDIPGDLETWHYDSAIMGIGKLASVSNIVTGYGKTYTYDSLGRPDIVTTRILNQDHTTQTTYDADGRIDTIVYPDILDDLGTVVSSFAVRQVYDANGYLKEIQNAATGQAYWTAQHLNASGQLEQFTLGNGLTTAHTYDPAYGYLTDIGTTGNTQALRYRYDRVGNLIQRQDLNAQFTEDFTYDGLNRLTSATASAGGLTGAKTYRYDALGNITHKSDFGDSYLYGQGAGPHAVTTVRNGGVVKASYTYDANGAMLSGDGRTFRHTAFGKVHDVSKGDAYSTFAYNVDRMRVVQTSSHGTTIYLDPGRDGSKLYEKEIENNVTTHIYYIAGGSGVIAERRVDHATPQTEQTRYWHKDHLGSVDVITDEAGNAVNRMSFDAFGSRRLATDWNTALLDFSNLATHHGYTGHEHLDELGIIHMNGRLYDAALGRFLSADPHVQNSTDSQAMNRYSYVRNNPLTATDPDGYFLKKLFKGVSNFLRKHARTIVAIGMAAIIGPAVAGALGNGLLGAVVGGAAAGFASDGVMTGTLKGAVTGAVVGAVSGGIAQQIGHGNSSFFKGIQNFGKIGEKASVGKWLAHGVSQGGISQASGGSFRAGFWGGFVGDASAGVVQAVPGEVVGRTMAAATLGGTAAVLGGGKFANGAMSAAFVHLFNHEAHSYDRDQAYPYGKEADSAASIFGEPDELILAREGMTRSELIRNYGVTGEEFAAYAFREAGFEVWDGVISVRSLDGRIRFPDLAIRKDGGPWEFVEVKVNTSKLVRRQILMDRKIQTEGFIGVNGPLRGRQPPANVSLFRVYTSHNH